MNKKILFRVDAGEKVGLGHFFRSYNLAQALAEKAYSVTFAHAKSTFWNSIKNFQFPHLELDGQNINNETINICLNNQYDLLYVDGILDFETESFKKLKNRTKVIFYQNLSESRHFADIYILPSIHQEASYFLKFDKLKTKIYQGLEYFTFNAKINKLAPKQINLNNDLSEIGIICGGSDPRNVTSKLYDLIDFPKWNTITFNFYLGENYMYSNSIPQPYFMNVNFLPYDMNVIYNSDLLIAAFGVSTYEFMALGMPIISIGHQESNAHASKVLNEKTKAIFHLGLIDLLKADTLNETIGELVNDTTIRKLLSEKSKVILDFKGIDRIVEIIERI
ncbi:hypothetical protein [Maribacter antarcticus]|uniref:hypothetical protein n=1 Tax=Maribacter antarcticus TaxID=505250 RepID=UPI000478DF4B|nr:hypothetical protein [Maribacter antarcticus]